MRELNIGSKRFTKVLAKGKKDEECNHYEVIGVETPGEFAWIDFQNGPVKQSGVNGCHSEDLIAIVIDRLEYFQSGGLACRENALALTKLEEAMHWLNHRTNDRINRDVEGKLIK